MLGLKYRGYGVSYCVETHADRGNSFSARPFAFDKTMAFFNESTSEVVVKDRFGVTTIVPPERNFPRPSDKVMFKLQWYLNKMSLKFTIDDLEKRYPKPSPLMDAVIRSMKDALETARPEKLIPTTPVWVDIPMSDVRKAGGRIYIDELDMTVALLEDDNRNLDHPKSPAQRARESVGLLAPMLGRDTLFFMIKAVDNNPCKSREDRYMWIGDDTYHIPIEYDPMMPDGITVVSQSSAGRKNEMGVLSAQPSSRLFTFEEADEILGLSTTVEGAKFRGNGKEALADKLNQAKLREAEITRELGEIKYKREVERSDIEKIRDDIKHQREMEKLKLDAERREQEQRRAEQDAKRDEVRAFTEWMRLAAGVITAGVAIAALVQKLKPA